LTTALGLGLYRRTTWNDDIELVSVALGPGDVFVDGGANVGLFTLVGAQRVGVSGHVVAFEPSDAARRQLEVNVRLNAMRWVEVRPEALSNLNGVAPFSEFTGDAIGLSSFAPQAGLDGRSTSVKTVRLDELIGLPEPVRLVKLDLEGAEHKALAGGLHFLKTHRPILYVELEDQHLRRQGSSAAEVVTLLQDLSYVIFRVAFRGRSLVCSPYRAGSPSGTPNILALPREMSSDPAACVRRDGVARACRRPRLS
jgi:FkbM family methyltransferase